MAFNRFGQDAPAAGSRRFSNGPRSMRLSLERPMPHLTVTTADERDAGLSHGRPTRGLERSAQDSSRANSQSARPRLYPHIKRLRRRNSISIKTLEDL